jgi:hypothetical protein
MPSPNSSFTDLITTTLQGYSGEIADNITNHNALLKQIERKGNGKEATGRTIVQELEYAENPNVMWYAGAEPLRIDASETMTAAEFNYKQLAGNVTITGLEEIQNSGREAVHNLLSARMKNLKKSLTNTVATAIYADGTGSSGKEFGGLQLLVADTNTNTVGGISGTTYAWWRNYVYDFSTLSITASSTTIQRAMNTAWINTIRGTDSPDIITAGQTYFLYYLESLQANQRFTDTKGAGAGFTNIAYAYGGNTPVVYDDQCAATRMYFLNTDYIFMRKARGRWMKPAPDKASVNQDAVVMPMYAAGNMTISNRERQAVICA